MKQRLSLFGLTGLYWLSFFVVSRLIFLIYHDDLTSTLSWSDIFTILLLGLRMDAAMSAYWIILTGFLLTATVFTNRPWVAVTHHIIVAVLLTISSLIVIGDLELYSHWGFRMDTTPLMYAGSEGAGSIPLSVLLLLITLVVLLFAVFYFIYMKKIAPRFRKLNEISSAWSVIMFLVTGLLFLPIRSSVTVSPLNTGVVYFHKTIAFANHAGINVVWNFLEALTNTSRVTYPENFEDSEAAKKTLADMEFTQGTPSLLINQTHPNVLLIILESFTAKVVAPLGGQSGVTPELNALIHEGILFDNFYASGDRTDKGIVSILSGYPSQPRTSIITFPNKTQSLPFLSQSLHTLGYHTSFVYGGDIGFANMESYLTNGGFSHITEDDDFDSDLITSKWGVHDHHVFNRLLSECDSASSPFFKVMLSLSSHEPFDVPLDPPFVKEKDDASLFVNACYYTDKSLGNFIREAKTKPWWTNTLVIITADHGHRFPDPTELNVKERFKIPMLWLGGALTAKDTVIHTYAGQTDIANTLLGQIAQPDTRFTFSKNILDPNANSFAVYIFHGGYGYVFAEGEYAYDFYGNNYIRNENASGKETFGKAYMQMLFSDYNKR